MLALGNLYELNPLWKQISTTGDPDGPSNYNSGYIQVLFLKSQYTVDSCHVCCVPSLLSSPMNRLPQLKAVSMRESVGEAFARLFTTAASWRASRCLKLGWRRKWVLAEAR